MKKAVVTLSFVCALGLGAFAQVGAGTKSGTDKTTVKNQTTTTTSAKTKETGETKATPADKGTAVGSGVQVASTAKPENKDYVKFDKTLNDYGKVKKGGDGNCEFVYKNNSKEPLLISSCFGSCGCTVPDWPKEPLLPGKTAVIKVHYDTNRPGPFEKTVTVNFKDHTEPTVLHIKGTVDVPPAEVPFGSQPANTGAPLEHNN